jgi:hypothetical protein
VAANRRNDVKKVLLRSVAVVAVVFLLIQLVPVDRANPPVVADLDAPAPVQQVLRTSCYDCHSHETRWPLYSRIAPVSWLVAHDVEEARDKMNFSLWGSYEPRERAKLAEEIWEEVEDGEMPLLMYRLAHPEATLSEAAQQTLRTWSLGARGSRD